VSDLRGVAWDSESILESDVIPTLRDILADTLDRIRAEVFDIHRTPPADGAPPPPADVPKPPTAPEPPAPPAPPAPAESHAAGEPAGPADSPGSQEGPEKD
jgi:hypothetical protein